MQYRAHDVYGRQANFSSTPVWSVWSQAVYPDRHSAILLTQAKLERHSVERMYLRQRCSDTAVNKTILKPCIPAVMEHANTYTWDFPRHDKIPHSNAYTISEKAIRFKHPDYNLDRAQKFISSSMSRHLSTRNISSKSMHAILSNLANRQTRAKKFTSSFVGGKQLAM